MKDPVNFVKPLVKIGDSFHIRVPMNLVKYLKLGQGDLVDVSIKIPEEDKTPKELLMPYKNIPELKDYSLDTLNTCLFLYGMENTYEDKEKFQEYFSKIVEDKKKGFNEKYKKFKKAIKKPENMRKIMKESADASSEFRKSMEISKEKD